MAKNRKGVPFSRPKRGSQMVLLSTEACFDVGAGAQVSLVDVTSTGSN